MSETNCCSGPGYETPLAAFTSGSIEKLIYVPAVVPDGSRPDYLATVDVDPSSETFSQIIHRLPMPFNGDELHHSGWNACSSCFGNPSASRRYLVLPALKSGNIYSIDVSNSREPILNTYLKGEDIGNATGLAYPHSSHCLGDGNIMISTTGKADGSHAGNFLLLTSDFKIIGKWSQEDTNFGYDFWYQPKFNTMISTEFGTPNKFIHGFNPADISSDYGSKLHVYNWKERTLRQTIDLGADGLIPLEIRFAHDPFKSYGFVGAALSSNIIYLDFDPSNEKVSHEVVIKQPWVEVEGWALPTLPPLITDILLSLDDKWLFYSNWLRGDVLVYDVSTPSSPVLADRLFIGGSISKQGSVKVPKAALDALGLDDQPNRLRVKGVEIQGGPQMLQLSLDGKRLYVTNSLLSSWDLQFYGDNFKHNGSQLIRLDFNASTGKLSVDEDFLVDFGKEPDGPVLAHECRYPGGDCSSDIWLAPGTTWES